MVSQTNNWICNEKNLMKTHLLAKVKIRHWDFILQQETPKCKCCQKRLWLLIPPLPLPHICESQPSPTVTGLTITSHQIVVGLLQLALKWQQTISK